MCGGGGDGPGAPLWIVSFSDMIANLVTFFILMATFASASAGGDKQGHAVLDGDKGNFGAKGGVPAPNMVAKPQGANGKLGTRGSEAPGQRHEKSVDKKLERFVQSAEYDVKPDLKKLEDGIRISLEDSKVFSSGSDEISDSGRTILMEIGNYFHGEPCEFIVETHTDDRTFRFSKYQTENELTRAMALNVANLLATTCMIEPPRIGIAPYGSARPKDSNESALGRSRNRRVEIVVRVQP